MRAAESGRIHDHQKDQYWKEYDGRVLCREHQSKSEACNGEPAPVWGSAKAVNRIDSSERSHRDRHIGGDDRTMTYEVWLESYDRQSNQRDPAVEHLPRRDENQNRKQETYHGRGQSGR